MGNGCSCTDGVVEPDMADNVSIDSSTSLYLDENKAPIYLFTDDGGRRPSNASQITHVSDEMVKTKSRVPDEDRIYEDDDEIGSMSDNEPLPSVGPLPNDRKMSTTTQEAVFIYQASSRAAKKINDENFKHRQLESLPKNPGNREEWKNIRQAHLPVSFIEEGEQAPDLHHQDLQIIENAIMEEDLRNKTRTGRQSLILQPQPESKILKEYRIRKTMGNIFEDTRFSETISETSANLSTTSQHGNFLSEARKSDESNDGKNSSESPTGNERRGSF